MTFKAFSILLTKQIKAKWGRMILASGGIMIGVWAITLTNGLSLGLNQTIVDAINSQPLAKEISINKGDNGQTGFQDFQGIPSFEAMSQEEIENFENYDGVAKAAPRDYLSFYIKSESEKDFKCVDQSLEFAPLLKQINPRELAKVVDLGEVLEGEDAPKYKNQSDEEIPIPAEIQEYVLNCQEATIFSNVYENFYETHKNDWVGSTQAPKRGEIVTCFECGGLDLAEQLEASEPQDLIGETVYVELSKSPILATPGDVLDVLELQQARRGQVTESSTVPLEIIAVIDDRDSQGFSLTGGSENNLFLDFSYYLDAIELSDTDINSSDAGFYEAVIILEDYKQLDPALADISEDGYLATSIAQILISSIDAIFTVQRVILFAFGIIILTASVFGIIAVMIISVLERRKEIGILKAMGAQDGDIFWLFLAESAFLGFLGWILGTFLFYLCSVSIQQGFAWFLNSNPDWQSNLENLNITDFAPLAPWWLLLATLTVSVIFTALSGLYPAVKAARQNPVDVLRSE
jgi:ABC-type antimicrobial peptide transport system permease subunit